MFATTDVVPFASVRRSVPLRAVCSTERSGSTAMLIGSPTSAAPMARVTFWKSEAAIGWATAAGAVTTVVTAVAAISSAVDTAALQRDGAGRVLDTAVLPLRERRGHPPAARGGRGAGWVAGGPAAP
jgi:hypothetical protein